MPSMKPMQRLVYFPACLVGRTPCLPYEGHMPLHLYLWTVWNPCACADMLYISTKGQHGLACSAPCFRTVNETPVAHLEC